MEYADALQIVKNKVAELANNTQLSEDSELIGDGSVMDSMKLVELCLALEDNATDVGFEFDWTSESAMSRARSMFRTIGSLATEYATQSKQ
jgi:acyl carrier protein